MLSKKIIFFAMHVYLFGAWTGCGHCNALQNFPICVEKARVFVNVNGFTQ